MALYDRLGYFVLGMAIGFVLGIIVRSLHDIKEELDEVDDLVKRPRDEAGFMRRPLVADVLIFIALSLCVWAAFSTQFTNNRLQENDRKDDIQQATILGLVTCNQQFLTQTIVALNERTKFTQDRADANVSLQQAQAEFLRVILIEPPVSDEEVRAALEEYFVLVNKFVQASDDAEFNSEEYPYPTEDQLTSCVDKVIKNAEKVADAADR